jgi:tRNA(fMet)-specific endonuclease VapC
MSRYVLDTDMLTLYQEGHPSVCRHVEAHPSEELAVTVISIEEQLSGWFTMLRRTSDREQMAKIYQRLTDTTNFLARLNILSFSLPAIERFENLRAMRLNIGAMDLRIAAIALEANNGVVTRNLRDFRRIPGLSVEDWSV